MDHSRVLASFTYGTGLQGQLDLDVSLETRTQIAQGRLVAQDFVVEVEFRARDAVAVRLKISKCQLHSVELSAVLKHQSVISTD